VQTWEEAVDGTIDTLLTTVGRYRRGLMGVVLLGKKSYLIPVENTESCYISGVSILSDYSDGSQCSVDGFAGLFTDPRSSRGGSGDQSGRCQWPRTPGTHHGVW
jgi:hypothetical protein